MQRVIKGHIIVMYYDMIAKETPQRVNVTQCSNQSAVYSEWKHFCLKLKKKLQLNALRKKKDLREEGLDRFRLNDHI